MQMKKESTILHFVKARKKGIEATVLQCLEELSSKVDTIYLTVDMDVLDIAYAPGVPASTPGGMTTEELLEGVLAAGRHPKVKAMDIVCLDPLKDTLCPANSQTRNTCIPNLPYGSHASTKC